MNLTICTWLYVHIYLYLLSILIMWFYKFEYQSGMKPIYPEEEEKKRRLQEKKKKKKKARTYVPSTKLNSYISPFPSEI